jgi:hypothetical protein
MHRGDRTTNAMSIVSRIARHLPIQCKYAQAHGKEFQVERTKVSL